MTNVEWPGGGNGSDKGTFNDLILLKSLAFWPITKLCQWIGREWKATRVTPHRTRSTTLFERNVGLSPAIPRAHYPRSVGSHPSHSTPPLFPSQAHPR